MRIIELRAENVLKLRAVSIRPDRAVVRVEGKNAHGKSSVLNSIYYAVCGAAGHPRSPIRNGADRASIRLDLGDGEEVKLSVIRRFTAGGTSLVIESPEGAVFKSPQAMLDKMIGLMAFDPLAFARQTPRAQVEQLRRIVQVDVDIDAIDAEIAQAYTLRTDVNRRGKSANEQANHLFAQLQPPLAIEDIDVARLNDMLATASEHNAIRAKAAAEREDVADEVQRCKAIADANRQRAAVLLEEAAAMDAEAIRQSESLAALPPLHEPIDTRAVLKELDDTREANRLRAKHRDLSDQVSKARSVEQAAIDESKRLTAHMEALTQRKTDAIAAAHMPIPGLSFGDGEITYNGVPFSQASSAEQIRVATAMGMALNPKVRILSIKDGSLLDEDSMAVLEQMAIDHDFQVWVECVGTSGVGVEMVDGEVASVNGEPVEQPEEEAVGA